MVFLVLVSFLSDDQDYWDASFKLTAASHPRKTLKDYVKIPVSALQHYEREILVERECTELGFSFSRQVILERKYLNLFTWVYFFTWQKYTGNTMKK